jgi:uncharacterized protein (DUF2141 family)
MQRLLTLMALPLCLASHAHAVDLHVSVHGVQADTGQVMLALYDEAHPWLKNALHAQMIGAASRGSANKVSLVFKDLPPGRYAISGYHDLNGNGELDNNAMRIPTEPVGFSNGAQVRFGPPRFNDAAITISEQDLKINIQLK